MNEVASNSKLPHPNPLPEGEGTRFTDLAIVAFLIAGTLALYGRVARFDFINFDDSSYVYENPHVRAGLTADNIGWAFSTGAESNWHPLTWLSLMLDVSLFGVSPGWMHLENALMHAASTAILFVVLMRMTGARWPSAWVAAMFAWHPLHVESVAWIAERKDVLSSLFMMLCLLAYERYARQPGRRRFVVVLILLSLGLMSKPMLVTLPCVLLLLDYWPLRQIHNFADLRKKFIEKWPMFAIVLASAVVTYLAQSHGRSVATVGSLPIQSRALNALLAYGRYLQLTFIPRGLAIFYPLASTYPAGSISTVSVVVSAVVLMVLTGAALLLRHRRPAVLVGWLWYLGTLVPVIGLVQVGSQSHADRYTYVPLIGIFIAIAWLAWAVIPPRIAIALAAISLAAVIPVTWRQIGTWQNAFTVMHHAADVVPNNYVALSSLGEAFDDHGDVDKAADLYRQTLAIRPNDALALNNLAVQAVARGDDQAALELYPKSILSDPNYVPAYNNYGNLLMRRGKSEDAVRWYRAGMKRDPDFAPIQHNLALALAAAGNLDEAIELWRRALAIDPSYADAHESLGNALIMKGETRLGLLELKEAIRLGPDRVGALTTLAWTLATHPSPLYQDANEARVLAQKAVELTHSKQALPLDALAAAQARGGKFDEASATASLALSIAQAQKQSNFAAQIARRIELYRLHKPFTSR